MAVITTPEKKSAQPSERRSDQRPARAYVLGLIALAFGLVVWALGSLGVQHLPGPISVAAEAGRMIGDGMLFDDALASLRRVFTGFALGSVLAIPVGFLMGWYPTARGLIEPYIQFFRTIPPLALIPLAIVLMGIGETPKVFVIFLAAFMACVVAAFQGVIDVDRTLINAARVLGASDRTIFLKVVIPASTPFILVGMRIALGSCWATVVAAELIGAQEGLGYRMQNASTYYLMPQIFVALIAIGVLGLVMDRLLLRAERRLTDWQERR